MEFRQMFYQGTPASRQELLAERDQAFRDVVDVVDIMVIFPSSTFLFNLTRHTHTHYI